MYILPFKICVFAWWVQHEDKYAKEIGLVLMYLSESEKDRHEKWACDFVPEKSQKRKF